MARAKNEDDKTSQVVHLEGENYKAVKTYHEVFTGKKQWNYSRTLNLIIEQWALKTPPALRGYEKP